MLKSKKSTFKSLERVVKRWENTNYYANVEKHAHSQWDKLIWPFIKNNEIDFSTTLELSCGHGRITNILVDKAERLIAVDVLKKNIDICSERFKESTNIEFVLCNGYDLRDVEDNSVTFIVCWDSMVHFDSDVIRNYLAETHRILKKNGKAFFHHSNNERQPTGDFNKSAHARNYMTSHLFQHFAHKEGLKILKSKVIDWGRGSKFVKDLDGLILLEKS